MILRISKSKITISYLSVLLMVGFMLLFLLRDVGGMSMNKFIFVAIAAVVFFLEDKNHMYQWIALMLPCITGLPGNYIMCVALILFCYKQYRDIQINHVGLFVSIGILVIELCSLVWGSFSVFDYVRFVGVFLTTFLFTFDGKEDYDYEKIVRNFIIGTLIAIVNLMGQTLNQYSLSEFFMSGIRFGNMKKQFGTTEEGILLSFNENGLAMLCALALMMCLVLFGKRKQKGYVLSSVLIGCAGVMTQSRAFLLVVALGLLLYLYCSTDSIKQFFSTVLGLLLGCGVFFFIIQAVIPVYIERFLLRFQVDDLSNGRIDIFWKFLNAQVAKPYSLPFGVGLQNYASKLDIQGAAHMALQQIVVTWGIVGLILVVLLFFSIIHQLRYRTRGEYLYVIPYFSMLIFVQSVQLFTMDEYILYFIVLFACTKLGAIRDIAITEKEKRRSR